MTPRCTRISKTHIEIYHRLSFPIQKQLQLCAFCDFISERAKLHLMVLTVV